MLLWFCGHIIIYLLLFIVFLVFRHLSSDKQKQPDLLILT